MHSESLKNSPISCLFFFLFFFFFCRPEVKHQQMPKTAESSERALLRNEALIVFAVLYSRHPASRLVLLLRSNSVFSCLLSSNMLSVLFPQVRAKTAQVCMQILRTHSLVAPSISVYEGSIVRSFCIPR